MVMEMARQLFCISGEVWTACTRDEIEATAAALDAVGAFHLPYESIDIEVPGDHFVDFTDDIARAPHEHAPGELPQGLRRVVHPDGRTTLQSTEGESFVVRFEGLRDDGTVEDCILINYRTGYRSNDPRFKRDDVMDRVRLNETAVWLKKMLCSVLCTRNIIKDVRHSKLAKLGIGKKPRAKYEYVTTLRLPHDVEDDPEHPPSEQQKTDRRVCRHLRRAHVRNQHYGPGNQFTKVVLIPPIVVNADLNWTKTRVRYNMGVKK